MGSVSDTPDPHLVDITQVLHGGEGFLQRMAELGRAKKEHDTAFETLKIGNDARAALEDAKNTQEQARAELAKAKTDATTVLRNARTTADAVVNAAMKREAEAKDFEAQIRGRADAYYAQIKQEADNLKNQAIHIHQEAQATKAGLNASRAELDAKQAAAAALQIQLRAAKEEHDRKVSVLADALAKVR